MLPLELIVNNLHRYWQGRGCLRHPSTDIQCCGYDYCAEGAIADIFLKHAPNEAATVKAKWDDMDFVWEENGEVKKEAIFLPVPVMRWIDTWHGAGTADKLRLSLSYLNELSKIRWDLEQIAEIIKIKFGLGDVLAEAKEKAKEVFAKVIQDGMEKGYTHGH